MFTSFCYNSDLLTQKIIILFLKILRRGGLDFSFGPSFVFFDIRILITPLVSSNSYIITYFLTKNVNIDNILTNVQNGVKMKVFNATCNNISAYECYWWMKPE